MSATDMFWQAPPISRTLAAATFTLSILVYTGLLPIYHVIFWTPYLFKFPPQIWRIITSFCVTGPNLGIIFDTYFLYTYGSKLEVASPKFSQPGDFLVYIVFVCATILGLNMLVTGGFIFTAALVLAFAYTSTQDDRGQKATFIVITIPAQWIPCAMLLLTLVMDSPKAALVQATGLVAAHLHDFLTRLWPMFGGGRNLLPTPEFVKRLYFRRERVTTYGTAIRNTAPASSSSSSVSGGGVLPESWKSRGSGHRLGGD